jgi:hypothetical protein
MSVCVCVPVYPHNFFIFYAVREAYSTLWEKALNKYACMQLDDHCLLDITGFSNVVDRWRAFRPPYSEENWFGYRERKDWTRVCANRWENIKVLKRSFSKCSEITRYNCSAWTYWGQKIVWINNEEIVALKRNGARSTVGKENELRRETYKTRWLIFPEQNSLVESVFKIFFVQFHDWTIQTLLQSKHNNFLLARIVRTSLLPCRVQTCTYRWQNSLSILEWLISRSAVSLFSCQKSYLAGKNASDNTSK